MKTVVQALEERRKLLGMSQRAFAPLIRMQNTHYSEFVNGKRELPIVAVRAAFRNLKIPARILLQEPKP